MDLLQYESHNSINDFLNSMVSHSFLPYILQPTRVTDHSATVINNIFSNINDYETYSGNITTLVTDHFAEFLIPYFLGLVPPVRLQILISAPVRVSAPPSDKRLLQISLDFDQKDGEPELFSNQLTSKSLGLFVFIECSVKYFYAVQKNDQFLKTVISLPNTE